MIRLVSRGNYKKLDTFFEKILETIHAGQLDKYGQMGIEALKSATPVESGKTADSWYYEIERSKDRTSIIWSNSNTNDGVNIAIIIQSGHGTGTGGYVYGIDYINPAIKPIFDEIAEAMWKEVTSI